MATIDAVRMTPDDIVQRFLEKFRLLRQEHPVAIKEAGIRE